MQVSFVMTAYNADKYIKSAIDAVLAQDYDNFDVIVVDDGSTDETQKICQNYNDPRFKYYRSERIGRSKALNFGIKMSSSALIAINDADDLSLPYRLSSSVPIFESYPETVLLGTGYVETNTFLNSLKDIQSIPYDGTIKWITSRRIYRNNPYIHSTVMFRKTLWEMVGGYDEDLQMCVDYDFFLKAKPFGAYAYLEKPTLVYYIHPNSFYKKKPISDYLRTNKKIRSRAWKNLNLPVWVRLLDLERFLHMSRLLFREKFRKVT